LVSWQWLWRCGLVCFAIWKESREQLRTKKQHELISCWIEKAVKKRFEQLERKARRTREFDGL
tara:strand:- start:222 stop:410 length:189 start_codon:yes stop_codon:yes gene_type:complete